MDETIATEDLLDKIQSFQVNYGMRVGLPAIVGMKIVVSDQVPDDKAYVVGDQTLVSAKMFSALKTAAANLGATTEEATDAFQRMGRSMAKRLDDKISETLAGTLIDPNPEQTEMERNPLWGAF